MNEELEAKVKALFPDDIELIVVRKEDYDRLYGYMTVENIELKQEIEKLRNKKSDFKELINKEITNINKKNEKEKCKLYTENIELSQENKRLHSIIKEVREYIEKNIVDYITNYDDLREELLEILDKAGDEK